MFRWYVINTYSGHENKVKANLEHRVKSMGRERRVRRVVVPNERSSRPRTARRCRPSGGVARATCWSTWTSTDEAWTPGQEHARRDRLRRRRRQAGAAQSQPEVDRMLHIEGRGAERPSSKAEFTLGESVKVTPARSPTSTARSPRSTRTRASSRCWSRSSSARCPSSWSSTRSRSSDRS